MNISQMEAGEFADEEIAFAEDDDFGEIVEDYGDEGDYSLQEFADAEVEEYPEDFDPDLEYKALIEDAE